ncbi:MAG: YebC/PmpR family DNA-binding transcriptional regulator [Oscillospiraceae bacterium]|jgi:YebC/PmpR family DNA-binding regulatory protein|nr:YebC/PmpR family DNA-binding transcriptional regulator [Oscillospiraceae bacterium]
MAGHSKWSTIKRKKGEKDGARAKVFTKISREILVCVKETGNADPANNGRLRDLIAKAKSNNIPNDNIDRLLKKAAGGGEKNDYEDCVYEGYGPNGVAVMVECLTDNRNRTAGEIRCYFDKYGGNMGASGCVAYLFERRGVVILDNEDEKINPDLLMKHVLEAGGDDFAIEDETAVVFSAPEAVAGVSAKLAELDYAVLSAEAEQIPSTYTKLTEDEHIKKMTTLLDMLEDSDDVQNVWHNWEL